MRMQFVKDENIKRQLESRGYAVVDLIPEQKVDALLENYRQDRPSVQSSGFHSTMFVNNADYRKRTDAFLKTNLQSALGKWFSEFEILFANYIVKEPRSESAVGIHQDWAFVDEDKYTSYNVWFPLVDTDTNNGCLWVLPGSHTLGCQPRYSPSDFSVDSSVIEEYAIPVHLKAGQAVIYHSGLIHYSTDNRSENIRPAVGLVCIPAGVQPLHFFREGNIIEKFHVDSEFYTKHTVDGRPNGYEAVEMMAWNSEYTKPINRHDIETAIAASMNEVGKYYDDWHERYADVYGDIIQAVRPSSDQDLLNYLYQSIGLKPGMRIVDAGAGTCGPAVHFGKNGVEVDALTVSSKQVEASNERIRSASISDKVTCRLGDYHELDLIYENNSYDAVIFLESLGHAQHPHKVIAAAVKLLKPGGFIYIKDFYPRETDNSQLAERIRKTIENINKHYVYNVLDLHETLTALRKKGMAIQRIAPVGFKDDVGVRVEFESRFNIEIFEGGEFAPAEWLEIKCEKAFDDA